MSDDQQASMSGLADLRWVLCDVDGVLTDGVLRYGPDGEALKCFHARDGHMIRVARKAGLGVGLVSGRKLPALQQRARELGLAPCFLGVGDKVAVVESWLQSKKLSWSQIAFIGDDLPDLSCLQLSAWSVAPADAHPQLRRRVDRVLRAPGGRGAVAECLEEILRARAPAQPLPDAAFRVLHG